MSLRKRRMPRENCLPQNPRRKPLCRRMLELEALEDRNLPSTYFVSVGSGNDAFAGTAASPFASIQKAVNVAGQNDVIEVAGGRYTYTPSQDIYSANFGLAAVVFVFDKNVIISGGYNGNFSSRDPVNNATIIDGTYSPATGGRIRGVFVTNANNGISAGVDLDGFTVENGLGLAIPARGGNSAIFGMGGGVYAELSNVTLNNDLFANNTAYAANSSGPYGGNGAGGGVAILSASSEASLQNDTFVGNVAQGGNGATRGGFAQGGGLFVGQSSVYGNNLTFTNNQALSGGSSNGSGYYAGDYADAQGGALDIVQSTGTFSNVTAENNSAIGGSTPNGDAGGGLGGAIVDDQSTMTLTDSNIRNNLAEGGTGVDGNGGGDYGLGGGINATNGNLTVQRTMIIDNTVEGGGSSSSTYQGAPGGGGISVSSFTQSTNAILDDDVISNNVLVNGQGGTFQGGGGGGVWLQGTGATIEQSTIAYNQLQNSSLQGSAVLALDYADTQATAVLIAYTILSNGTGTTSQAAVYSAPGNDTVTLTQNLFAGNNLDTNASSTAALRGTFVNSGPASIYLGASGNVDFVAPSSPSFDYQLQSNSPAINKVADSPDSVDLLGNARPYPFGGLADIGAYEYVPTSVSGNSSNVGVYDPGSGTWYLQNAKGSGAPNAAFQFGAAGWRAISGDWNDDGATTIGVVDPNNDVYLRNSNSAGAPDAAFTYGQPGWTIVTGDWNEAGATTIAAVDPSSATWYIRYSNSAGGPSIAPFQFGMAGWIPVAGDWDGNGTTTVGMFDPTTATWYLRNTNSAGGVDYTPFQFGQPGWIPVVGDWDGYGNTGIGVVNPSTGVWYLRNTASPGAPDYTPFNYGAAGWTPVSGNWDGTGGQSQLVAGGPAARSSGATPLTEAALQNVVSEALTLLGSDGVSPLLLNKLRSASYEVGQLPGGEVGVTYASANTIVIDASAAGYGWFLDGSAQSNQNFVASGDALTAKPGSAAAGKVDLLTVVLHEMSHLGGKSDVTNSGDVGNLLDESLPVGMRRIDALDSIFSGS